MAKYFMILLAALIAPAVGADKNTAEQTTEWLFVQNAHSFTLENGVLTLTGIGPTTLYFSDRPERYAAHRLTSKFVTFRNTGGGSDKFKKSPPNATFGKLLRTKGTRS